MITMLLFLWGWQTTRRTSLAAAIACSYTLIPALFLFEANLLTETLTAFLLVLSFVLQVPLERARGWVQAMAAAAMGLTSGAVGLVRILFYPLTLWLAPFVATSPGGWRGRSLRLALFLVPALLLLVGWIRFIDNAYGSATTMGGYNWVQPRFLFRFLPDHTTLHTPT
jgi:hypothetical protein